RNPQDVNIEAISQEISRKKKEALLREAEMMEIARKKEEDEAKVKEEEEEKALALKAEGDKAREEEEKKAQEAKAAAPAETPATPGQPSPAPGAAASHISGATGLSLLEKSMIGVGGLVLLLALVGIISIMLK